MRSAIAQRAASLPIIGKHVFSPDNFTRIAAPEDVGRIVASEMQPAVSSFPRCNAPQHHEQIEFPPAMIIEIVDATVQSPWGIVRKGKTQIHWQSHLPERGLEYVLKKYRGFSPSFLGPVQVVEGTALCLSHVSPANYYHFMLDLSIQLQICRSLKCWPQKIVVCGGMTQWKADILRAYGVSNDMLVIATEPANLRFQRLWLVSPPCVMTWECDLHPRHYFYRSDLVLKHSQILRDRIGCAQLSPFRHKRLFVTRRGCARFLANEDRLLPILEAHHFKVVDAGKHSLAEQIAMFSSAEVILGVHGAAMTNILFAPVGARICELVTPDLNSACFAQLAHICSHHYASPISGSNLTRGGFTVAPQLILRWLEAVIAYINC